MDGAYQDIFRGGENTQFIIVGAGWAGQRHVEAIKLLQHQGDDHCVAALVDVDKDHLAAKADELQVEKTYTDLETCLGELSDADAVVLATPHHLHLPGAQQAAAAGMHVLVEKPMTLTLEHADAMIETARTANVTLMVAESARYNLSNIAARDAIAAGKIGQVLSGRINFIVKGRHAYSYPGRRAWLSDPETPGAGIWMLNGIHQMSVARMLLGEPTRIYAREVHSDKYESPLEATIVSELSFASGAEVTMTVSAELHGYKTFGDTVIFGSDGTLCTRRGSDELSIYTEEGVETIDCREQDQHEGGGGFVRQMSEFISAIRDRREPFTSGPSERRTLAAILAGYESVRTAAPVDLQ
jgi:predicted dehydrogenase